jgi:PhnB protein
VTGSDEQARSQRAAPILSYEDVGAAIDWLGEAFGFRELEEERHTDEEGHITHAELILDGALVMLGWPGAEYRGPTNHAKECDVARRWLDARYVIDGVWIRVDDVNAHLRRARAAGATILGELEDQPHGRFYRAADIEGHRWMFMQQA